ncbi:helix-turn-helix domain-containing protein [Ochrobactrum sp. Q0168]|nr:helix-turn-helix domain-containing protein [Ochrobactrum sp. Q0168]
MMPGPENPYHEIVQRVGNRRRMIIAILQTRFKITAGELSAQFNTTDRTIYRDISALRGAGYPILGEAGVGYILRGNDAGGSNV